MEKRFREILHFWWRNLGPLFLVTAPFALGAEVFQWVYGPAFSWPQEGSQALTFSTTSVIFILLLRPLMEGAQIAQVAAVASGKPGSLAGCLAAAVLAYPALLVTYTLLAIGVGLGWMAFFFPALWVYTRLGFAPFLVLLEKQSPLQALQQSFALTERIQWPLLLMLAIVFLTCLLAGGIVSGLIMQLVNHPLAGPLLASLPVSLLGVLINITLFRYWDLTKKTS